MIIGYRLSEVLPDGTGPFLQSGLENFSFYGRFCSKSGKGGIPRRVGWKFCFSVIMITDVIPTTLETCCYYFFFYIFSFWVLLSYAIFLSCKNIKLSILFFLKYWALLPFSKYIVYFLSCTISFLVKILILFLKYWALLSFPSICDINHFLFVIQFLSYYITSLTLSFLNLFFRIFFP